MKIEQQVQKIICKARDWDITTQDAARAIVTLIIEEVVIETEQFYHEIKHGDAEHMAWLKSAVDKHVASIRALGETK